MHDIKTKQQLLQELVKIQNELEGKVKVQDRMIKKFQRLFEQDGLSSQIIGNIPYPLAVFTPQGTLTMTNQALMEYAKLDCKDIEEGKCNITQLNMLNNLCLSTEYKKVFTGETILIDDLNNERPSILTSSKDEMLIKMYQKAVLFPIVKEDGTTTHGVVLFMNQSING